MRRWWVLKIREETSSDTENGLLAAGGRGGGEGDVRESGDRWDVGVSCAVQ